LSIRGNYENLKFRIVSKFNQWLEVINIKNVETFLALKLDQVFSRFGSEGAILYRGFYDEINNEKLKEIFSIVHQSLNNLFSFMNHKNLPGSGGHYNANESRTLIDLIEQLRILQASLNDEYSFEIDDDYAKVMENCRKFLSSSGGSAIPEDFPLINVIENRPIFNLTDSTAIQSPQMKSSVKIQLIGGGSYAKVFKYKDSFYGCHFALKRANKDLRPDEIDRFKNEYKDLKVLDSPFIIKAYHYDDDKNEYTMELADQTLEKYIEKNNNTIPFIQRKILITQLLKAFEYIHAKGLLHRDISYQNILVKHFEDGSILVKVSDFGLVKRPESKLTRHGTEIKGAINDYSDLMVVGFENYEIRHETYALTQVIYFILTGRKTGYHREQNDELRKFILRGIATDKDKRFDSINEIREQLFREVFPSFR
jgi:serine/threonine-protein kinase